MKGEDSTLELLVLVQAPGARNNGGVPTALTGVGAAGSSAVWSDGSSGAGGFAGSGAGGAQGGGTGDRDVDAKKDLIAAAAKVKRWVKDWGLNTPSKAKAAIWENGWFKVYGGQNMRMLSSVPFVSSRRCGSRVRWGTGRAGAQPTL